MYLLKSYFNSKIKHKILNTKRKNKEKPMPPKLRRLSGKRVFIGKGDLKHTSTRVIITFYIYNTESMFLARKLMQTSSAMADDKLPDVSDEQMACAGAASEEFETANAAIAERASSLTRGGPSMTTQS